jgi:hypothetical protein
MKSRAARIAVGVLVGASTLFLAQLPASAESRGLVFGVKPGMVPFQGSYLGFDAGTFQPFAGLDLIRISVDVGGDDLSGTMILPHIGSKVYFADERSQGEVIPYVQGGLLFSIPSVNWDGMDADDEKLIEDALGFWGLNAAFGSEYYFSDAFSVGGEYGVRYFSGGADGDAGNDDVSVSLAITYIAVTLNFHLR